MHSRKEEVLQHQVSSRIIIPVKEGSLINILPALSFEDWVTLDFLSARRQQKADQLACSSSTTPHVEVYQVAALTHISHVS